MEVYKKKLTTDKRFICHGDLWINNVMVNANTNETVIIDWQTLCSDHPVMDLGYLLGTGLTPDNLDNWTNDLMKIYFEEFERNCAKLKVAFSRKH